MNKVEAFIATIRDSFEGSETVYTQGSCYKFYEILNEVFEKQQKIKVTSFYSERDDHVISLIDGDFYDITGKVSIDETYHPLGYFSGDIIKEIKQYMYKMQGKIMKIALIDESIVEDMNLKNDKTVSILGKKLLGEVTVRDALDEGLQLFGFDEEDLKYDCNLKGAVTVKEKEFYQQYKKHWESNNDLPWDGGRIVYKVRLEDIP